MKSPKPNRSSNSRTRTRPPSEVTRDPWKSIFSEALKESSATSRTFRHRNDHNIRDLEIGVAQAFTHFLRCQWGFASAVGSGVNVGTPR